MIQDNQTPAGGAERAAFVRDSLPQGGLFAGQSWRIATEPFVLGPRLAGELESLGRVLLKFYEAANLLYRQSAEGKQPGWVAGLLDQGKPSELITLQRSPAFKLELPRVIRPDILLTQEGFSITELDSVPGGMGLTAWLNQTYGNAEGRGPRAEVLGGTSDMLDGFASIFGDAPRVRIIVSEEAATYRPEMEWMAGQLGSRFTVHDSRFTGFHNGDAVYRFFELFDLANVDNHEQIFQLAAARKLRLTPPPKTLFEEKLLFALLWNRNLREFWRVHLGEGFLKRLLGHIPYSWVVDPAPLPPHAALPGLDLTDWRQLKTLSHRERELILKVSGFAPHAWGARGVYLGSDLSHADWAVGVDRALREFPDSPWVLQRFARPSLVKSAWYDFESRQVIPMDGRVRLCPYYFVSSAGGAARAKLCGALATICPADKKIIHGMDDAILAPCTI
ncbi:MAG: hypothetical protein MUC91_13140 [Verrucomicrobia bacterium]|nr:hypothetical protein [Verrucomicrobiota bacterium]